MASFLFKAVGWGGSRLIRAVGVTQRIRYEPAPRWPAVIPVFHNQFFSATCVLRRQADRHAEFFKGVTLISPSRDGQFLAETVHALGGRTARGSSSRRGGEGFREMAGLTQEGYAAIIAVDGPKGPRHVVKPGAVALARASGLPLVPLICTASRKKVFSSWDRFELPLPYGELTPRWGDPRWVAPDASEAEMEKIRADLEREMRALSGEGPGL